MGGASGHRNLKRPPRELRERRRGAVPLGWRPAEGRPGFLEPCAYERAVGRRVLELRAGGASWGSIPGLLARDRWGPRDGIRWMPGITRPRGAWSVNTIKKLAALAAEGD